MSSRNKLPSDFYQLLEASSRTFNVGICRLRRPLRDEVALAYLLLRVSDFLEDAPEIPSSQKAHLLEIWAATLEGHTDGRKIIETIRGWPADTPDLAVAENLSRLAEALRRLPPHSQSVLRVHVKASTLGMARWARKGPLFQTEADLDDYMFEVAGRVGHLLTELFAHHHPILKPKLERLMPLGRQFGLALQTVNVIRGLHEDPLRGWVFIPSEFLDGSNCLPGDLWKENQERAREITLRRLVSKARMHLAEAEEYVRLIPRRFRRIRVFCLLPLFFAARTLSLSASDTGVFFFERKITRQEVHRIVLKTTILAPFNSWGSRFTQRLLKGPSANPA